jgi:hippurate hydrolase
MGKPDYSVSLAPDPRWAKGAWGGLIEVATAFRRELHRQPELTWQERDTAASVRGTLDALEIPWSACAETGTVARLAPDAPGRHIALRGDMDALPIHEDSGVDWSSTRPGCMHACGHDGHTATLMAAAAWLKRHEAGLPGPVTLLFQPAEEGGHGAKRMIEGGALQGIDEIFGWHNWPAIPFGQAVCPDGAVMAGNGTFRITIKGAGGHASQPEACRDPVLAASAVIMALQQVVSRRLEPQSAVVLSVTSVTAESADTVIPDTTRMRGSFRLARAGDRAVIHQLIQEVAASTAAAYGTEAEVELFPRYDPTINHGPQAEYMRHALKQELRGDWMPSDVSLPIMASEDFSYYLKEIPGAFALLGAGEGINPPEPCHSPRYDFNDRLIPVVCRIYARLAGAPLPDG